MRKNMKKSKSQLSTFFGLLALASILTGCSSGDKLPCPAPGEVTAYTNPGEELVGLTIQNDTCMSICVLLVSPDHCEYMGGENWVKDHPLRSQESLTMYLPPSKYAVWVELCTEEFRADEHLKVDSDYDHSIIDPAFGSTPPCDTSLTIVNNATVPICNLRIGISESVYTGWNWVGAEHIQPGDSLDLTLRPDTYFIRAEACDGTWLRSEVDVSISGHQTWTVP
jgi:hypothetical protein